MKRKYLFPFALFMATAVLSGCNVGTKKKVVVKFFNDDGRMLAVKMINAGEDAIFDEETPTKNPSESFVYTFKGWNKDLTSVQEDINVIAIYDETPRQYLITFVDDANNVIETQNLKYGEIPHDVTPQCSKENTSQFTYTFECWEPSIEVVKHDQTYQAKYKQTLNSYQITWSIDGEDIVTTFDYGTMPSCPIYPTKDGTEEATFQFAKWEPEVSIVTHNETYVATFNSEANTYTVSWVVDGVITQEEYKYGETPSFKGDTSKESDEQYTYTFTGFDKPIHEVNDDVVYVAQYSKVVNKYTVTWVVDGKTTSEEYEYGSIPAFKGNLEKESTNQFDFEFIGWDKKIDIVKEDITYTAQYKDIQKQYEVTFKSSTGDVLQVKTYSYGETPEYDGETPTKLADAQYTYEFSGWDKPLQQVQCDITYTAKFEQKINTYEVKWLNSDGTSLKTDKDVPYGTTPSFSGTPTKPSNQVYSYGFIGWNPEVAPVSGNTTYIAMYAETINKYQVTWNVDGVKTIDEVPFGTIPVFNGDTSKTKDAQFTYTFTGWDTTPSAVVDNVTYTAQYSTEINKYTVKWVDYDDTILSEEEYEYGEYPYYKLENPTRTATDDYIYTFDGWDKTLAKVTGDVTYKAQYLEEYNGFVLTFKDNSGTTIKTINAKYGEYVQYSGPYPTIDFLDFNFSEWDQDTVCTGDMIFYPVFYGNIDSFGVKLCKNEASIVFYDYDEFHDPLLSFPSELADYPVVALGDRTGSNILYAVEDSPITSIVIPSSVKSIGSSAFSGTKNLSSVYIPDSVTYIGESAFAYCAFTEIFIPASVTYIGIGAFQVKEVYESYVGKMYTTYYAPEHTLNVLCEATEKPENYVDEWNIYYVRSTSNMIGQPSLVYEYFEATWGATR